MTHFDNSEIEAAFHQWFEIVQQKAKEITDWLAAFAGALSDIDWTPIRKLLEDLAPFVHYMQARQRLQANTKLRSIYRLESRRRMQRIIMQRFWNNYPDNSSQ
jgi:hypothetical protein